MADGVGWVFVVDDGSGTPQIRRASHWGINVTQEQPGVYTVTFPERFSGLACIASLNSSMGMITAVPGDSSGQPSNTVSVSTMEADGSFAGAVDFSLAVFFAAC